MARLRCPEKTNRNGGQLTVESDWCESECPKANSCPALTKKLGRLKGRKSNKPTTTSDGKIYGTEYDEVVITLCGECHVVIDARDTYCKKCGKKFKL